MQTFLVCRDFKLSAESLDMQRLGKQRIEALQILKILLGLSKSWSNHPAVLMWKGHEHALATYGAWICAEWVRRGCEDTIWAQLNELSLSRFDLTTEVEAPPWVGDERVHSNHRARLLHKAIAAVDLARMDLEYKKVTKYKKWIKRAEKTLEHTREVYKWYLQFGWKERPVAENYWPVQGGKEDVRY